MLLASCYVLYAVYAKVAISAKTRIVAPMKTLTPTQAAQAYAIRTFGPFLVTMPESSKKQLIKAYVAGVYHGKRMNGGKP